ncbi:MAG: tetratricopeptide repeat protein [Crocinitomicaceae bacterium]|nr:tetratricopeptide repeat protein [Crocinitomicaceae bacterium]
MAEDNKEEVAQEEVKETSKEEITTEGDGEQKPLLDKNGKLISGLIIAILVCYLGWFGYTKFVSEPAELAAQDEIWWAENAMHFKEDYNAAILGDSAEIFNGLERALEDISGTQAGLIAQFDLGIAYLNKGEYEQARAVLVDVDFGDQMVTTVAKGAIGDSYMQEGDAENAIKYYDIAISNSSNSFTCPLYLKKCAFAHESIQQWNNAITCYERIKNEFPESDEAKSAEKYLVKAQANSTAK